MLRVASFLVLHLLLLSCSYSSEPASVMSKDEKAIRESRELFNRAIATHDTRHIGDTWKDDFWLLTSTNMRVAGKSENIKSFTQHFKERPDVIYVRTPDQIKVFKSWDMASEYGNWEGSWEVGEDEIEIGGTYYAKWQKVENKWLLLAEVYTATHCQGGDYCTQLNR